MLEENEKALPEGVRRGNEKLIKVTEKASQKLKALISKNNSGSFFRLAVSGGGCNGLSYKRKLVNALKQGDILVSSHGIDVIIDSKSALFLKGTLLDYSTKMVGGGFKFSNPNAKSSCSCGESFSI